MLARLGQFVRSDNKIPRIRARLAWSADRFRIEMAMLRLVKSRRNSEIILRNGLVISGVDPDIEMAFEEIWINRDYFAPGFDIQAGDVVVDLGAHVGLFSLYAAHQAQARRVISYEPSGTAFALLTQNLLRNDLRNVTACRLAVAGQAGTRTLFSRPDRRMGSSLFEENFTAESLEPAASESVRSVTLEQVFQTHSILVCDFLKMDCERSEYEILEATPDWVWRRIRRIAMEYHVVGAGADDEWLRGLLSARGFLVQSRPFPGTWKRGLIHAVREGDATHREST